ncbi:MAG: hypothetical protein QOK37_3179 [Thermoanaerobaculia bacterium]|jgi:hypothetical protein|nr:hypothetical protein [Thermoanaerobaculia bacterium]
MIMDLDGVIKEMYDSICFEEGQRPDWSRQTAIFARGARMVRVTDDGVFEFDPESYRINLEAMIDSGAMPSFWEREIWRETRQFGEVAHVLSAYETRRTRDGEIRNRGVNSIQLFQRDGQWWISAMLWRRDGKTIRIPEARE